MISRLKFVFVKKQHLIDRVDKMDQIDKILYWPANRPCGPLKTLFTHLTIEAIRGFFCVFLAQTVDEPKNLTFQKSGGTLTTGSLWCRVRLNPEGSAWRASTLISTIFFWLNICIESPFPALSKVFKSFRKYVLTFNVSVITKTRHPLTPPVLFLNAFIKPIWVPWFQTSCGAVIVLIAIGKKDKHASISFSFFAVSCQCSKHSLSKVTVWPVTASI